MFADSPIKRRKSTRINVGNVPIGDGAPIAVQSMTNTRTTDVAATVDQINRIVAVGGEIVRVSVPTMEAAEAFKEIKKQVSVPLVADIHFDYRLAIAAAKSGADGLRINPGNIGSPERVREVIEEKLARILEEFGVDKLADVLDSEEGEVDFETLYASAMLRPEELEARVEKLAEDLGERLDAVEATVAEIEENAPLVVEAARKRLRERIEKLAGGGWLSVADAERLRQGRCVLPAAAAERMVENAIGVFGLPFAIAPNFVVNGREHLAAMAVEEPSVVAGLSMAAALARKAGGFEASCDESLLIGQVHVAGIADVDATAAKLTAARDDLLSLCNEVHPRLVERGGGARDIETRALELSDGTRAIAVHILVDTCDAMGANLVNTICEALAPTIAEVCDGEVALRILSNLADRSLYTARAKFALPGGRKWSTLPFPVQRAPKKR